MTAADREALRNDLIRDEGLRLSPYKDTVGKWTIGVGYNIDDRGLGPLSAAIGRTASFADLQQHGLTREEAIKVLDADIAYFVDHIQTRFPEFSMLNGVRQRAVANFVFNLGGTRALKFEQAIAAVRLALQQPNAAMADACYTAAAFHIMDSLWARQIGDGLGGRVDRADRLCRMIRTGMEG
jgi:lysozyme